MQMSKYFLYQIANNFHIQKWIFFAIIKETKEKNSGNNVSASIKCFCLTIKGKTHIQKMISEGL